MGSCDSFDFTPNLQKGRVKWRQNKNSEWEGLNQVSSGQLGPTLTLGPSQKERMSEQPRDPQGM